MALGWGPSASAGGCERSSSTARSSRALGDQLPEEEHLDEPGEPAQDRVRAVDSLHRLRPGLGEPAGRALRWVEHVVAIDSDPPRLSQGLLADLLVEPCCLPLDRTLRQRLSGECGLLVGFGETRQP